MKFDEKRCAVALLWYGKPKLARRALQSIAALTAIDPQQVLCYDNGSQTTHSDEIRQSFPGFLHFRSERNGGYAGGFNGALRWAFGLGYDSALFLTSDTEMSSTALPLCLQSAARHNADLIAPQVRFRRPPQPLDAWAARFDPAACQLVHYRNEPQSESLQAPWDYIPGTALWLNRQAFEGLNGIDESYFMYWEDVDLCVRAHRSGLTLARSPALILHGGSETCAKKPLYTTFYYLRNRLRFCRLHLSGPQRDQAQQRFTGEFADLFAKWRANGDSLRCQYIAPLQAELSLW